MKEDVFLNEILKFLADRLRGFCLGGGTALSNYYFHHRQSFDLDFFINDFSKKIIKEIISDLEGSTGQKIKLALEQSGKDKAQIARYVIENDKDTGLKIDFIEDVFEQLKQPKVIDGIPIFSLDDIYLRKVFAACGSSRAVDDIGKKVIKGGRQEAKDFFDLYYLSQTYMPLSQFAAQNCGPVQMESIVIWHRRYDRMSIKDGLLDIKTDKNVDYRKIESHFNSEVEKLIKQQL